MEEKNSTCSESPAAAATTTTTTEKDHDPLRVVVHRAATADVEPTNLGVEDGGTASALVSVEAVSSSKRKRGRPSKCAHHVYANTVSLLSPPTPTTSILSPLSGTCEKRGRGRPRGSGKLQLLASLGGFAAETAGGGFTPHVVTVQTGEDIFKKILSFSQRGPRAICILSAAGAVSIVILRQPGSSNGLLRYEGRFEILSLSGSFTFGETGSAHRRNGALSITLAKPDGRVFGGGVAGPLIAAGPIQLVVGSFKQNISKEIKMRQRSDSTAASSIFGDSVMVGAPIRIAGIAGTEENCATPMSAGQEPTDGDAINLVTVNQNFNPDSQNGKGENVSQTFLEQRVSPETGVGVVARDGL